MRCFLLFLGFTAQAFGAGLGSYSHLVVGDSAARSRDGVRMTYLGTNGYQFEFKGHALLVDPYFSRVDLLSVALVRAFNRTLHASAMDYVISRQKRTRFS